MRDRQFNIWTISIILIGPFVTLFSWLWERLGWLAQMFPVTMDSLVFIFDASDYKEIRVAELIFPFFFMKVLVLGVICLVRTSKKLPGGKLLYRFYILIFIISLFKCFGFGIGMVGVEEI